MKILTNEYEEIASALDVVGYNGKVFGLEIKRVNKIEPLSDEEEQVEALVKN